MRKLFYHLVKCTEPYFYSGINLQSNKIFIIPFMKVLFIIFKFLYLIFPIIFISVLSYKMDKWVLLVGIFASYIGSFSKIYDYKGIPILYTGVWLYLMSSGIHILSIYTFLGLCLFWGYVIAGCSIKCSEIEQREKTKKEYAYN